MSGRIFVFLGFCCLVFAGCGRSPKVLFEGADEGAGMILVAAIHKTRPGMEGWDLYVSVKSSAGGEIARSTITSLDTPDDVGNGESKIIGMVLDERAQRVRVSFQNGRVLNVPVVLRVDEDFL